MENTIKNKNLVTRIRTLEWSTWATNEMVYLSYKNSRQKNPAKQGDAYHTFFGAQHC